MLSTTPHIAILYMGGTFGCTGSPLSPMPAKSFLDILQTLPLNQYTTAQLSFFTAPSVADSSSYTAYDWLNLVALIQQLAIHHVIVIHGTDTLCYAAALTQRFLTEKYTVIFTGSQYPLLTVEGTEINPNSDALSNLIFSLQQVITQQHGVYVAFANQCLPAHDVIKTHRTALTAFHSPERHLNLTIHPQPLYPEYLERVQTCQIIALSIYPLHLTQFLNHLKTMLVSPPDFLILNAFGVGNLAVNPDIAQCFDQLYQQQCLIILNSQVPFGELKSVYAVNEWTSCSPIVYCDTASDADLYAKLIQLYLLYPTVQQRYSLWSSH